MLHAESMRSPSLIAIGAVVMLAGACAQDGDAEGAAGAGGVAPDSSTSTAGQDTGGGDAAADELPDSGAIRVHQQQGYGEVSAAFWRGPPLDEPSLDGCDVVQAGSCRSVRCPELPAPALPTFLDAGALSLAVGGVARGLEHQTDGWYFAVTDDRVLATDGPTTLTASGADVPSFAIDLNAPPRIELVSPVFGSELVVHEGEDLELVWEAEGTEGELEVVFYSLDEDGYDEDPTLHRMSTCTFDLAARQGVVPSSIVADVATGIPSGVMISTRRKEHLGVGSHDVAVTTTDVAALGSWKYVTAPCGACEDAAQVGCNPSCGSDCDDIVCDDGTSTSPPMLAMGTTIVQIPAVTAADPRCAGVFSGPAVAWAVVLEVPPEAGCVSVVRPEGVCDQVVDHPLQASPGGCSGNPGGGSVGFGGDAPSPHFLVIAVPEDRTTEPSIVRVVVGTDDCPVEISVEGCPPSFD